MDHNICHIKMHHVMIKIVTWEIESATTSVKPQESLSIVTMLHTMMPALAGAIVKHKSH